MRQPIRASQGFEKYHIKTRKRWFLYEMQWGVPCKELVTLIQPHYPEPQAALQRLTKEPESSACVVRAG